MIPAGGQGAPNDMELDASILRGEDEPFEKIPALLFGGFEMGDDFVEHVLPCLEIHGSTVVGIDQREIPEFVSLIEVGSSGGSELHERAGEAVPESRDGDSGDNITDLFQERLRCGFRVEEQSANEIG